jgi:hypothetical protein
MSTPRKREGTESSGNEGEGSRSADKEYRDRTRAFIETGRVEEAAEQAAKAVDGPEAEELRRAEEEGRSHAS